MALTDRTAQKAWDGTDKMLSDGRGLFLLVRRASKTWIVRRRHLGRMRVTTLGRYPEMDLKTARARAAALAARLPGSTTTVAQLVDEYKTSIRTSHRRPEQVEGYLDRALPAAWSAQRVAAVTRADVVSLLKAYRPRGERATDALRGILRAMFGLAVELGLRDDNPADQITRRVTGYHPVARERVLSDAELKLLWADPHPNAALIRFLVLTGVRISEAQKANPAATGADGIWRIPGSLTKTAQPTWVYLTATARAQLAQPFKVTPTAVQAWCKRWCARHGIEPAFTPHDARRTFSTRLNALGIEPWLVERMLNHALVGAMSVYNRADYQAERTAAYEALERHVLEVVAP